jgi:MOSC domain-containing protein YiiM
VLSAEMRALGLSGDGQRNKKYHGGCQQAIRVTPVQDSAVIECRTIRS